MLITGQKFRYRLIAEPLFYFAFACISIGMFIYAYEGSVPDRRVSTLGAVGILCVVIGLGSIVSHLLAPQTIEFALADNKIRFKGKSFPLEKLKRVDIWTPRADSRFLTMNLEFHDGKIESIFTARYLLDTTVRSIVAMFPADVDINVRQPVFLRWLDNRSGRGLSPR
ncbi:hypothetical protein [Pseudidiomarina sediminum]|uniref:hypothetical protein n=1 Tax=Pseudidiomarina sediminum TaxID=431675 RepID=UPI001C97B014|nr:hypothetical protein [Pseudidiomarina sediminum]MBY6063202.1 hypothetical protein [Pseudidiomarina sediminum]